MKKTLLFGLIALLCAQNALAYIDPGTGGMIVGSVWPFIVAALGAVAAFVLKFFRPIKNAVGKVFKKKTQ